MKAVGLCFLAKPLQNQDVQHIQNKILKKTPALITSSGIVKIPTKSEEEEATSGHKMKPYKWNKERQEMFKNVVQQLGGLNEATPRELNFDILGVSEDEKLEAWRRRAEAIIEPREAEDGATNEEGRNWEDWVVLHDETNDGVGYAWDGNGDGGGIEGFREGEEGGDSDELIPMRDFVETVRDVVLGREDDDLLYEDRVFRYGSLGSARFLAILNLIPWLLDLLVHDYILMPFLDRYVKTVPLAAELLDVRTSQKLEKVHELKLEKARFGLKVGIRQAPPLSESEIYLELRQKALELRDDKRSENRRAFSYILSDLLFGISLFFLLYFNQSELHQLENTRYQNKLLDTTQPYEMKITELEKQLEDEHAHHQCAKQDAESLRMRLSDQNSVQLLNPPSRSPQSSSLALPLWLPPSLHHHRPQPNLSTRAPPSPQSSSFTEFTISHSRAQIWVLDVLMMGSEVGCEGFVWRGGAAVWWFGSIGIWWFDVEVWWIKVVLTDWWLRRGSGLRIGRRRQAWNKVKASRVFSTCVWFGDGKSSLAWKVSFFGAAASLVEIFSAFVQISFLGVFGFQLKMQIAVA
ncbi:hypothetical protein Drorol1_Dr00025634, partial [Drosera rotundifolia]